MSRQSERIPRIFLCHASEDKPRVMKLYDKLKKDGYHPWLDKYDLLPGQNWRWEIEKIIRDPYSLVLVCLSSNSVTKRGVVQQEIAWALDILDQMPEDTIYLIPVRLEECSIPDRLSKLHWVNLFEPGGIVYLKRALNRELGRHQVERESEPATFTQIQVSRQPASKPASTKLPQVLSPRHPFEPELILIPAGEFLMGSDPKKDKAAQDNEQPQHKFYLPDYYIAKTPVTNAQFRAFVQKANYLTAAEEQGFSWIWTGKDIDEVTGADWQHPLGKNSNILGKGDHPVVQIDWHDAVAYCLWLARVTGKAYRLPTEEAWEKAARGMDGRMYPWGNQLDATRCNTWEGGKKDTTPVDAYPTGASPYGVLDMAGNVIEWTASLWGVNIKKPDFSYPDVLRDGWENLKASPKIHRVQRGNTFNAGGDGKRCASRGRIFSEIRFAHLGFRVMVFPNR